MTEPQTWTIIGVLAAAFFGTLTLISTSFTRVVRAEISGLRGEMTGEIGGLRGEMKAEISELRGEMKAEISEMKAEISELRGEMNTRFDLVNNKIDHLDRDVQYLMGREANRD